MQLIPAIDIQNKQCVRLQQGDFNKVTIFPNNPIDQANEWFEEGAARLHIVDLDGAKLGSPQIVDIVAAIVKQHPNKIIQVGGGIRSLETIQKYIDVGVHNCIIGSQIILDKDFLSKATSEFPQTILIGMDAKKGYISIHGWQNVTSQKALDLVSETNNHPIAGIIYTDIEKDGMMVSFNYQETQKIAEKSNAPVFVSGGVSTYSDIEKLAKNTQLFSGAIIGRALYEGSISLHKALEMVK